MTDNVVKFPTPDEGPELPEFFVKAADNIERGLIIGIDSSGVMYMDASKGVSIAEAVFLIELGKFHLLKVGDEVD